MAGLVLSLDIITLGVAQVHAAADFYESVLAPIATGQGHTFDMHGTGQLALAENEALAREPGTTAEAAGFRGFIVSYIVSQPTEVENLLAGAVRGGAKILKPGKKGFFGAYSGVWQAPDGSIWKVSAPGKKDTGIARNPPLPTETAALLGVREPKASRAFCAALGDDGRQGLWQQVH